MGSQSWKQKSLLGGSSHESEVAYIPGYKWINSTYPMEITGVITHLLCGMSHQIGIPWIWIKHGLEYVSNLKWNNFGDRFPY